MWQNKCAAACQRQSRGSIGHKTMPTTLEVFDIIHSCSLCLGQIRLIRARMGRLTPGWAARISHSGVPKPHGVYITTSDPLMSLL